jgi:hypothetical protein
VYPHAEIVSLRGASELTSSYLKFAVTSILYNRQIFPRQSFASAQRFGCEVRVTKDEWLEKYLTKFFGQVLIIYVMVVSFSFDNVLEQFETWLVSGLVLSLDLTLSSIGSAPGEFLETWRFSIQSHVPDGKSSKYEIDSEILSFDMSKLLHSIDHSCSFLIGIPQNCKFDLDVYCDPSASASESWTQTTGNVMSVEKSSVRSIKVCTFS